MNDTFTPQNKFTDKPVISSLTKVTSEFSEMNVVEMQDKGITSISFEGHIKHKCANDFVGSFDLNIKLERDYLFTAVKNLRRQTNFLQLNLLLESNQISEDEYDQEIDNNENKYVIPYIAVKPSTNDFKVLCELISKLDDKDLSIDDVADIFSLDLSYYEQEALKIQKSDNYGLF